MLKLIQRANSEEDRAETLKEVRARVEEIKGVLRLARDSGASASSIAEPSPADAGGRDGGLRETGSGKPAR